MTITTFQLQTITTIITIISGGHKPQCFFLDMIKDVNTTIEDEYKDKHFYKRIKMLNDLVELFNKSDIAKEKQNLKLKKILSKNKKQ